MCDVAKREERCVMEGHVKVISNKNSPMIIRARTRLYCSSDLIKKRNHNYNLQLYNSLLPTQSSSCRQLHLTATHQCCDAECTKASM